MTPDPGGEPEENGSDGGPALAMGVVAGIILFAVTDNPVWIAIGVAVGAALAARERASS